MRVMRQGNTKESEKRQVKEYQETNKCEDKEKNHRTTTDRIYQP